MAFPLAKSDAPNLGPVNGLEDAINARQQDNSVHVDPEWFLTVSDQYLHEQERTWRDQNLLWELVLLMVEGKQILRKSSRGNSWRTVPLPDRTDSPVYALNLIGFYSDNIKAKWTQSRTDVMWRGASDREESIGAAKAATTIHEHYQRKLYTESFRQMEAMYAQCGKYARYYYYSDEADGGCARREVYGTEQIGFGEGAYFCADCGAEGSSREIAGNAQGSSGLLSGSPAAKGDAGLLSGNPAATGTFAGRGMEAAGTPGAPGMPAGDALAADTDDAGMPVADSQAVCPHCGSSSVEVEQAEPLEVQTLQGHEEVKTGDLVCEVVPLFEIKHDIGMSPQDSPYLIRQRRVRVSVLQSKFPWLKIKSARGDDPGLRAAQQLRESTFTGRKAGMLNEKGRDEETADFIQVWLDPCVYSQHVLRTDYRTLDGNVIPAGTKLIEMFPDGIYLCRVEGVEGALEVRNEHHRDFWAGGVYRPRAMSGMGCGIEDMVEGQRQYNLVMSLIYTQLRTATSPAILYEESLLPGGASAYLGNALKNIPVRTIGLPEQRRLQDAVHQLAPQPPSQAHFGYGQQLDFYLQKASRVTDFSGGLPGVNNETATGAQIASANSQSLFGPQLALKAEVDRLGAKIILNLFRKYCFDERYFTLTGKRGQADGQWLRAADVEADIYPEVVPESFLPQTSLERRERLIGFLAQMGGWQGLKAAQEAMPGLVEELASVFDVDLGSEDYTFVAETCRERIEQMKAALPSLQVSMQQMPAMQMQADPMTGEMVAAPVDPLAEAGQFLLSVLQPPIELEEIGHLSAINWYRAWLSTDEGRQAPQELRAGAKAAIAAHLQGVMAEAQITGMVGMAGQPMPPMPPDAGNAPKNQNPKSEQMGGPKRPHLHPKKENSPASAGVNG